MEVLQTSREGALPQKSVDELGPGQYHLAVAGGSTIRTQNNRDFTYRSLTHPLPRGGTDPIQH